MVHDLFPPSVSRPRPVLSVCLSRCGFDDSHLQVSTVGFPISLVVALRRLSIPSDWSVSDKRMLILLFLSNNWRMPASKSRDSSILSIVAAFPTTGRESSTQKHNLFYFHSSPCRFSLRISLQEEVSLFLVKTKEEKNSQKEPGLIVPETRQRLVLSHACEDRHDSSAFSLSALLKVSEKSPPPLSLIHFLGRLCGVSHRKGLIPVPTLFQHK